MCSAVLRDFTQDVTFKLLLSHLDEFFVLSPKKEKKVRGLTTMGTGQRFINPTSVTHFSEQQVTCLIELGPDV
jgi:hypothetical protein